MGAAGIESVTASLEAARSIGDQIAESLAAQAAVEALLRDPSRPPADGPPGRSDTPLDGMAIVGRLSAPLRARPRIATYRRARNPHVREDVGSDVRSAPILSPTKAMIPEVQVFAQVAAISAGLIAAVLRHRGRHLQVRQAHRQRPSAAEHRGEPPPRAAPAVGRRDRHRGRAVGRSPALHREARSRAGESSRLAIAELTRD